MTKEILLEIIDKLHKSVYTVVATTFDMGSTNMTLQKSLNISIETEGKKIALKNNASLYIQPTSHLKYTCLPMFLT